MSKLITKHPPWKHQLAALDFVAKQPRGVMLAMDMGTGKSKVVIDLIQNSDARRILILAPKSMVEVWPRMFADHWAAKHPIEIAGLDGGSVEERTLFAQEVIEGKYAQRAVVINYEAAWRKPFRTFALETQWDVVVADESHRMKKPGGKTGMFMALLAKRAGFRICLTGTPMPHSPLDIYSQFRFLDSGIFGTNVQDFKGKYAHIGGFSGREIIGWHDLDKLEERMSRRTFRASADVLDLPPAVDVERTTALEPDAKVHYKELEKDFITEVQGKVITVGNALVKLLRLHEMAGGWLRPDTDNPKIRNYTRISLAKQELFEDVLEDLPREPLVVFARFRNDLDVIHDTCIELGRKCFELSGQRNELTLWRESKDPAVIAVQLAAGSEGIDLTKARYGIYYSMTLSNGQYQQSRARLVRPGQTKPVTFIHLLVRGTVDRKIYSLLAKNQKVVAGIMKELEDDSNYADTP